MDKPWDSCKWLNFHKAAAIVIPHRHAPSWTGFYLPVKSRKKVADLELPEGRYSICTDFDFDNPRTDYDRACKALRNRTHALIPVGRGKGLVLGGIGQVTYCPTVNLIVFRYAGLPDLDRIEELPWERELTWRPGDTRLTLMNACLHGAEPDKGEDDVLEFHLEAGKYSVTSAGDGNWFRFRRIAD
jgi:hypothetical protein